MPTWALYNSKRDWKGFLDKSFAQMAEQKTSALIIDLRGNEGGMDVGDYILQKIIRKDLPLTQFSRWVRYRKTPAELNPYLDTWDPSFKDWGVSARDPEKPGDGFYRLTTFDDVPGKGETIKASPQPFGGRVYVLVDASNSSATFEFAQTLQRNRLATLVGQPTGGNQRGINGGAFFFLRLPHSKIEIDLPLIGFFPPELRPSLSAPPRETRPDTGLTPEILVTPTIEDIARGVDTEMETVRRLLAKKA